MKSKFPGYYHPSAEHFDNMLSSALIVFDTNILLDLYRVSSDTSNDLMEIIRKLDRRLWIPYQVAYEYHKDLFNVIGDQIKKYEEAADFIKKIRERMAEKRNHPFLPEDLSEKAKTLFAELEDYFKEQQNKLQNVIIEKSIKEDLGELLEGKVGECLSQKELEDIYLEGKSRYESKIPPGYMDVKDKQGNDVYGDLVIWKEVQKKSIESKRDVIIVTDDVKEDWFMRFRGKTCGPHPLLIKEFKDTTKHNVYIYTLDGFLALSGKLKFEVKNETLQEIENRKSENKDFLNLLYSAVNSDKGETMQSSGSVFIQHDYKDYSGILDKLIELQISKKIGLTQGAVSREMTEADNLSQVNESSSLDNSSAEEISE